MALFGFLKVKNMYRVHSIVDPDPDVNGSGSGSRIIYPDPNATFKLKVHFRKWKYFTTELSYLQQSNTTDIRKM
jgi:hypothetical protein